jgi:THO complex subunit 1
MTVHREASQDAVALRLDHLLQRARIVKTSSTIDPPLQVSELVPENEPLFGKIEGEKEARWLAVDSAAKGLFYAYLVSHVPMLRVPCS